jgi:hypothetical protein
MIAEKIDELELMEVWYEDDPTMRLKVNFPFFLGTGTRSTAVVYFEIEPGHRLATHTDSAEEILLVLEGTAEVSLGDERAGSPRGRWRSCQPWSLTACATRVRRRCGSLGSSQATWW